MSSQPSLLRSAKPDPQYQPTGFALAAQVTSSKVPSPRLRISVLPDAICRNTAGKPNPDCRKIWKYNGMSVYQTFCRTVLTMYRATVGGSANHACSDRM